MGGHPDRREDFEGRHNNNLPERYSAATGAWTLLSTETETPSYTTDGYPRLHLLPGGDVFFSTVSNGLNRFFDAHADAFGGEAFGPQDDSFYHKGGGDSDQGNLSGTTSVLLPLLQGDGYQARVMVCGGAQPERTDLADGWHPTGARSLEGSPERWFLVAVILPTGHVFVTGGTSTPGGDEVRQAGCVREGELYDPEIDWDNSTYLPGTGTWTHVERATVRRHYHSSALLMPDGSVWTAGSNGDGTARELRIEIYRPPYMGMLGFEPWQQSLVGSAWGVAALLGIFFSNQFADRNFAAERFMAASHLIGAISPDAAMATFPCVVEGPGPRRQFQNVTLPPDGEDRRHWRSRNEPYVPRPRPPTVRKS